MILANLGRQKKTSILEPFNPKIQQKLENLFSRMESALLDHQESTKAEILFRVDLRYFGQSHELSINWNINTIRTRKDFDKAHKMEFGISRPLHPIQVVSASASLIVRPKSLKSLPELKKPKTQIRHYSYSKCHVGNKTAKIRVFDRLDFFEGFRLKGPAVVTEPSATTFIPDNFFMTVDKHGCMHLKDL